MQNLVRFTLIILVIFAAMLLTLFVGGVLESDELWSNFSKVLQFVGIFFVASAAILLLVRKK